MDIEDDAMEKNETVLQLATEIVAAYVSHNQIPMSEIPAFIKSVYSSLGGLNSVAGTDAATTQRPAIPVKKSVTPDYIICLEDGAKLKMLKRYLRSKYNLSPEEYRAKWGLGADYPMVAPNYAKQRSEFAKQIGLGRIATAARQRGRKRKVAA